MGSQIKLDHLEVSYQRRKNGTDLESLTKTALDMLIIRFLGQNLLDKTFNLTTCRQVEAHCLDQKFI